MGGTIINASLDPNIEEMMINYNMLNKYNIARFNQRRIFCLFFVLIALPWQTFHKQKNSQKFRRNFKQI